MGRLIDADVALKHIDDYYEMLKRTGKPSRGMTAVVQNIKTIVNSLQTVDAEPVRHGKWMKCNEDKWEHIYALRCSECHGGYHLSNETTTAWNYCPNCGARMDEE